MKAKDFVQTPELKANSMQQLVLPDCVETRSDGAVVVRGHRVSLFLILQAHYDGLTVEEIHERYPTITMANLHEIVAFTQENEDAMRQFFAEQEAERKRIEPMIKTLSLEELRQRKP